MKHAAMGVAAHLLNSTRGVPMRWLYGGRGHILMFHRVHPQDPGAERLFANAYLEVTPEYLQGTIDYFRRYGYAFLSINDVVPFLQEEGSDRPFVAYTFDDGFRDNLEHGLPLFQRNHVPFCINVTTGLPDRTMTMWWNDLEHLLMRGDELQVRIAGETRTFSTRNAVERTAAFKAISRWLKYSDAGSLDDRVRDLLEPFDIDPLDQVRALAATWDELRTTSSDALLTIGAHTVSHPVLAELPEDAAFREMAVGRQRLEEQLGRPVVHFAYPYGGKGEIGARELNLAERAGFETAVTTFSSNVHSEHVCHALALPRIAVGMSMTERTFDLIRHGAIPMIRNRGRRVVTLG